MAELQKKTRRNRPAREPAWFWQKLDDYLLRHHLKATEQRREIIQVFLEFGSHIDAEELHQKMKTRGDAVGLATIYRTLKLLLEAGLIEEKRFADGRNLYEIANPEGHHDHLVCLDCGAVIEFENEDIEKLQHKVAESLGFKLASHRLDLFGHCRKPQTCKRKKT